MPTINISSLPGIHQNSNVTTGGGTDDTSIIQAALTAGPFPLTLVQDGASLVTGLNISSNTTLQCDNSTTHGFYLANSSNREIIRNVNRSATIITDTNITLDGGVYNANQTNQSGVNQADHTPMCGIGIYGISNLTIKNLTVKLAAAWNIGIGNYSNVLVDTCSLLASTTVSNLNTDGVDLRGPGNGAVLSNLTILAGDDALALNARNYASSVVGPYITGGGTITNTVIKNITLNNTGGTQGCFGGIDLLGDVSFGVNDTYISNVSGSVQNYVLYLNRDLFNTPPASSTFTNLYFVGSTVTQLGTPFGGLIPSGLWLIDVTCNTVQISGLDTILPQVIKFPTSAGNTTNMILMGQSRGSFTGSATVDTHTAAIVSGTNKGQLTPSGTGTTAAKAFPGGSNVGATEVVFVFGFFGSGACTISGIADTLGNSYTQRATFSDGASGHVGALYTCISIGTGANTVTVTFGQSTAACAIEIAEYTTSTVDQVSSMFLDSAETTVTCPTVTTTKTNEVVIGVGSTIGTSGAVSAGGFTVEINGTSGALGALVDKQIAAIGAVTPSWTQASVTSYRATISLTSLASQGSWTLSGNAGVAGATITYSGAGSGTTTSDSTGNWQITGLATGAYTITPTKASTTFSPASLSPTIAATDITAVVFTAAGTGGGGTGQVGTFMVGP